MIGFAAYRTLSFQSRKSALRMQLAWTAFGPGADLRPYVKCGFQLRPLASGPKSFPEAHVLSFSCFAHPIA